MKRKVEYVWMGNQDTYNDFYSKIRTLEMKKIDLGEIPKWNFDGSSTGQSIGEDTEVILKPVKIYTSKTKEDEIIVLCECYDSKGKPTVCNTRYQAEKIFEKYREHKPMYGLEQEYVIMKNNTPYGWTMKTYTDKQKYYCSHGNHMKGREFVNEHYNMCLDYNINICGINAEVTPSQWEFQIGPSYGVDAADDLIMARFLYQKISEQHNINISYHPKPIPGNWNGSGCHVNFSSDLIRNSNGIKYIHQCLSVLSQYHTQDLILFGTDIHLRLTGHHETSNPNIFTYGIGTRHTSVRIPNETASNLCGYFEDRRPCSNIDPYIVTSTLLLRYIQSLQ